MFIKSVFSPVFLNKKNLSINSIFSYYKNDHDSFVQDIFSKVAPGYDVMNFLMSFGLDHYWRQRGAQFIPWVSFYGKDRFSFTFGDGACGTGDMFGAIFPFLLELYEDYGFKDHFFNFLFIDPNEIMLDYCKNKILSWSKQEDFSIRDLLNKNNKEFHYLDIMQKFLNIHRCPSFGCITKEQLSSILLKSITYNPWALENMSLGENSLDLFTLAFGLRNVHPEKRFLGMQNVWHGLKPNGWFWIMEFTPPQNTPFPEIYKQYLKILPFLGKWVVQDSQSYEYLIHSIYEFPPPREIEELLKNVGFTSVETMSLFPGVLHVYRGQKK